MDQSESPDLPPEPPDLDEEDKPHEDEAAGSLCELIGPISMELAEIVAEEHEDFDALIRVYADAKRAIQIIETIASEAEKAALVHIPWETGPRGGRYRGKLTVEGVGTFTASKPAMKTVWDDKTMRLAIAAAWDLGHINSPVEAADVAMSVLYAGTQFRKKALDELGLDVPTLNEAEYGATRLRWF